MGIVRAHGRLNVRQVQGAVGIGGHRQCLDTSNRGRRSWKGRGGGEGGRWSGKHHTAASAPLSVPQAYLARKGTGETCHPQSSHCHAHCSDTEWQSGWPCSSLAQTQRPPCQNICTMVIVRERACAPFACQNKNCTTIMFEPSRQWLQAWLLLDHHQASGCQPMHPWKQQRDARARGRSVMLLH